MGIRQGTRESGKRNWARRRSGIDFPMWDGMHLDVDPGAIPPNAFRELWNIDHVGSEVRRRYGQLRVNTGFSFLDTDACVSTGYDFQQQAHRLFVLAQGCPGVSTTVGRSLGWYDPDFSVTGFQRMLYFDWQTSSGVITSYGGELYAGVDSQLLRVARIEPIAGVEPITTVGLRQHTTILVFPGYNIIAVSPEFDGKLFISAQNIATPASSIIYAWDGLTVYEDKTGTVAPTAFQVWQDKLAVGYPSSENKISLRSKGDPPGTYADVAPGAGTIASKRMVEHGENLYISDNGANVWRYTGSALAVFRSPTNANFVNGLASFNGFLYYGYQNSLNSDGFVGRWIEGSVFEDTHKNLTTQFGDGTVDALVPYKGRLAALFGLTATSSRLVESPDLGNTGGTWTEVTNLTNLGTEALAL